MNRKKIEAYLFAFVYGLLSGSWILESRGISMSKVLVHYSFGYIEISSTTVVDMCLALVPYMVFQIVAGTSIYKSFITASTYIFSRCPDRRKWILGELLGLGVSCMVYTLLFLGSGLLLGVISGAHVEKGFWFCFAAQAFIISLWLFWTTTLINIISMFLGSYLGTIAAAFVQFTFIGLMPLWTDSGRLSLLPDAAERAKHFLLLKLNPISQLVLCWHSSRYEEVNYCINTYGGDYSLVFSIGYVGVLTLIVIVMGVLLVGKVDVIGYQED